MFESAYENKPLGSVISDHVGGGTPSRQVDSYWKGDIPWASVKDFPESTGMLIETEEHISRAGLYASASNLIPVGTPLVCTRMAVGRAAMPLMPVAINQDVKALFPAPSVSPAYLLRVLQFVRPKAEARAVGSTVKGIRISEYLSIPTPLAPTSAQPVISQILDTVDTAIRETEAIIAKLKFIKQGLLQDLLTRGIDENGELRPPHYEAAHLYKESPLGWIPKKWTESCIEQSCEVHNNLRLPIASEIREKMQGPYPYYGPTGILDYINEFRVDGKYVLIGEDGDHFLKFADWPMTQLVSGRFNVNNHAHLLKGRLCMTEWIDLWFKHRDITLWLTRQGAGRFKLNKASLLALKVGLPSRREQEAICSVVHSYESRTATELESLAKLSNQKAGLMDDLLTGRVHVTSLLSE